MKKIGWLVLSCLLISSTVFAQQVCDPQVADSCQQLGFPLCFTCDNGECVSDDAFCDDGNDCTLDNCFDVAFGIPGSDIANGCENTSLVLAGETDLPAECFICDPTANEIEINNGICDQNAGENCSNSPDCQSPGETCATPPPPPEACIPTPGDNLPLCGDGDVCTADSCVVNNQVASCLNVDLLCNPAEADGCCPKDCVGPGAGETCRENPEIQNCDLDCWPVQSCGDGLVEAPETCDDNDDTGVAGVRPDGTDVDNDDCRDPGTDNECTYCGDGILDVGSEECDGNDDAACATGCDTNCTCINVPIDLEGSGCALNTAASAMNFGSMLLFLFSGAALYIWKRKLN